jgi:hypothetical protein
VHSAAVLASTAISVLMAALLLAVLARHVGRTRHEAREVQRRDAVRPLLHDLLEGEASGSDVRSAPTALDEVVLHLLPQLRGGDRQVLQRALAERGVVDRAAGDLTARAAWRRGRAAALLGSAAGAEHVSSLAALLADRAPAVRSAAARALGTIGDPAGVRPLLAALSGRTALPSGVVGMALLDLGTAALPDLREALLHGSEPARALAAELVGLHGDLASSPVLIETVRDHDQPPAVRLAAAVALGRIGSPRATDALCRVLAADPWPPLQHAAAEALGRIGDPTALAALAAGLASPAEQVVTACAEALAALGPEGMELLETLAAGPGAVAATSRAALAATGTGRTGPGTDRP